MTRNLRMAIAVGFVGLVAFLPAVVTAQVERYELGKRLRRFEDAWQTAPERQRSASAKPMIDAVNSFFGLRLQAAMAKLDEAWLIAADRTLSDWQKAVLRYRLEPSSMVVDDNVKSLRIAIKASYGGKTEPPADALVGIELSDSANQKLVAIERPWSEVNQGVDLDIATIPSGDFILRGTVVSQGETFPLLPTTLSKIDRLSSRLESVERTLAEPSDRWSDSLRATIKERVNLLKRAQASTILETDLPFCRLLLESEQALTAENPHQLLAAGSRDRDQWLVLAEKRKQVAVRVRAPRDAAGPLPVLFLFHGAGGSENMFFETYGSGRAVTLGIERGCLVVAPRQGLVGLALDCAEMLDLLASFYELDRSRVFLIGHSMGAAQVIRQVSLHPELPAAASAIGGGRPIRDPQAIAQVPWFVAAGALDFGRSGAKAFFESVREAGGRDVQYREYPGVEHMVIVQAALDDVFQFFDQVGQRGR